MIISLILACDLNNAIGYKNQLLCHLPNDLKFFKKTTTEHCIAMGRKTFESIGKALPNRTNLVLTNAQSLPFEGITLCHSVPEIIEKAESLNESELFVIGGGQLYQLFLEKASRVYLTRIHAEFEADTYFPVLDDQWISVSKESFAADEKNLYAHDIYIYERTSTIS